MSQPSWKLVYATDYSALYRDETGVYDAELSIAQTDDDAGLTYVYRFPLKRCCQVTNDDGTTFLTDMDPARAVPTGNVYKDLPYPLATYVPWFADSLGDVARSVGSTREDLIERLCTDDPKVLASAYEDIGGYHGFDNFDSYPEVWTEHEFDAWPDKGKMRIELSQSDDDDGMVTVYCSDKAACRKDQSIDGSHWETPGDLDVGYASIMDRPTLVEDLEKEGYDVDASDYTPPDAEDLARWQAKLSDDDQDGGS